MKNRFLITFAIFAFLATGLVLGYDIKDVSAGTLSGKITTGGSTDYDILPKEKNPEVCGTGIREIPYTTVGAGGALRDVVVFLDKVAGGSKKFPAGKFLLNQKGCEFIPWLMVMEQNKELEIVNQDPVLHNIHTYELIGKVRLTIFNEAQPTQGYTFKKKVKMRRSPIMKVECDAHNFMHAFMLVLKNPYYSVTKADGMFNITDIPDGDYKVVIWHARLGKINKQMTISGSAKLDHKF